MILPLRALRLSGIAAPLLAAAVLLPSPARAQDPDQACRADAARLCQGIRPGGGRILACLKSQEADLSPGCQQRLHQAREKMKAFAEACRPDAERLCKGIRPGQGRVAACLKSHEADLAPACRAQLAR